MNINHFIILLAGIIALAGGIAARQSSQAKQEKIAQIKINFSLPDIKGKQRSMDDWSGKIRVVNFWATWCPPCLKEIPTFIALQKQFKDNNLQFIGIAIEDRTTVTQFLQTTPINYPILIGGDAAIQLSRRLGNTLNAVPYTLVINQLGQIIYQHPGELSRQKLITVIKPLLTSSSP